MGFLEQLQKISPKSKSFLGLEFAPLAIPMERRQQTLGAIWWLFHGFFWSFVVYPLLFLIIVATLIFFSSTFIKLTVVTSVIGYLTWMWIIDWNVIHTGARRSDFVRNWRLWKWFNEYFPIKIVKTPNCELDPRKNYLFCSHPHGLLCLGVFGALTTHGNPQKKELLGEFDFSLLTFDPSFMFPIQRDIYLGLGVCASSKKCMNNILGKEDGGNVAVLIPGGAAETLEFCPGKYILQLKKRQGFIKIALKNGSPLVPVFSFGENVIFSQIYSEQGSILRTLQEKIRNTFMIPPVLWYGRGIFQYTFGWLPRRQPITVVGISPKFYAVGAPINVDKVSNPSQQQIDELHEKYIKELSKLFYEYRELYSPNPDDILVIT